MPVRLSARGFSLVELMVVAAIIGVLTAFAIPTFFGQRSRTQDSQAQASLSAVASEARSLASSGSAGMPAPGSTLTLNPVYAFPDPSSWPLMHPYLVVSGSNAASTGPNVVSAALPNGDSHKLLLAALSETGRCWILLSDLDAAASFGMIETSACDASILSPALASHPTFPTS